MKQTSRRGWEPCVGDRTNVKPFYSSLSAFRPGADVVLIGANPAGDPSRPPKDSKMSDYQANLKREDYNAYLDESWDDYQEGAAPLQQGVRTVFSALYGSSLAGDNALMNSVCFNVCPIRTKNIEHIPKAVWSRSQSWCMELLYFLNPGLIICNGIGKQSALSTVNGPDRKIELRHLEPLGSGCVRYGLIGGPSPLVGCGVLGIHHLSRVAKWEDLPRAIAGIAEACKIP